VDKPAQVIYHLVTFQIGGMPQQTSVNRAHVYDFDSIIKHVSDLATSARPSVTQHDCFVIELRAAFGPASVLVSVACIEALGQIGLPST
jgi:hypothetical protein